MKKLAMALLFMGIAILVYGVISYSDNRTTIGMGSMSATISENQTVPRAAIVVGGIVLIGGVALLANGRRRV